MNLRILSALASIAIILAVTLVPTGSSPVDVSLRCLVCGDHGVADFIANLLLFVPLGVAVGTTRGFVAAAFVGAAFSIGVEATQLLAAIPGRHVTVADVIANSSGALVGGVVGQQLRVLLFPSRRQAAVLLVVSVSSSALLLLFGSYLLERPESGEQYKPQVSSLPYTTGYGWFERDVVSGVVDGVAFPHLKGGALRVVAPQRDSHDLTVKVRGRDRRDGFVPMLFVHAKTDSVAHIMIGQRGDHYALRVGVRANKWGLRLPDLIVQDPVGVPDTVRVAGIERQVEASVARGTWRLSVRAWTDARYAVHRVNTLQAWLLVVPFAAINSLLVLVGSIVYTGLLAVPVLYFGWCLVRRRGRRNINSTETAAQ